MMNYEMNAYDDTDTWLNSPPAVRLVSDQKVRQAMAQVQEDQARALNDEIDNHRNDSPPQQEAAFRKFLLSVKLLPPHKNLSDLYR
jgi:hypothetical protein